MEAGRFGCVPAPVPRATQAWSHRLAPAWQLISAAVALIWPARCAVCARLFTASGPHVCPACTASFALQALAPGEWLDARWSAGLHQGALQESIVALKAQNQLWRARGLAGVAAEVLAHSAPERLPATILAVPPSPKRLVVRGYDPVHHLARGLATSLGCDYLVGAMRRDDRLRKQAAAGRAARLEGDGGWQVAARDLPAEVLLVDDVSTTGATLQACAKRLREAGCQRVVGYTLSAVPAPARSWRAEDSSHASASATASAGTAGGPQPGAESADRRTIAQNAHANLTGDAPRC